MTREPAPLVLTAPEAILAGAPRVGGKAAALARLAAAGQPVPAFYAVTTEALRRTLAPGGLDRRLEDRLARAAAGGREDLAEAAREVVELVRGAAVPPEVEEAVARAHRAALPGGGAVAVRSSAVGEDSAGESFAGVHESFLYVEGVEAVLKALRRVWASAYGERALAYRLARGLPLTGIGVAAVVQRMVDARTSGVAFTADPTTGSVYHVVVSALWGAGEGLVSAGLDADTFVVDKDTGEVESRLGDKRERLVRRGGTGGGLAREPVPEALRQAPSLAPGEVEAVARAALAIEDLFGCPQDVELAFEEGGELAVLQARPVTTVEELGPAAGHRLLWDNSNIIESYSGVTSPMTFSFIRRAYAIVYHCFAEVMGIPERTIRANRRVFEDMLGLFRGQVYYNLQNWYRLVRLFPGYGYNRAFMESMMGVRESARLADDGGEDEPGRLRRTFVELPALLRLGVRSCLNFLRIRALVGRFEERFRRLYERWSALDFRAMRPHQLRDLYREMEDSLLWHWKEPIVNDFFVMVFYGTLKRLCGRWCGDGDGSLQNDLLCGEGGIESTAPTRRLLELARLAAGDPELAAVLREGPPAEAARRVTGEPRFAAFAAEVEGYLALYGFRCPDELKLEEPSLKEDPSFLYRVLANYLAAGDGEALDPEAAEAREREVRRRAEERAFAALGSRRGLLPRRLLFRWVLANARLGVKNRENLRFARSRIYGLLRELLRALGEGLAEAGILERAEDVFYLTLDEVWAYLGGAAVTTDLKALTALRRRELDAYRSEAEREPADRFETFGIPYHRNRFQGRPRPADPDAEPGVLRGVGCCPGRVAGEVKVLRSPSDDVRLAGEILVAGRTDPGWVPLYPSVSGLLIERGSILSHSAIVAREMGLPTIVGIPDLTSTLANGQRVEMDGATGTVRLTDEG